MFSASATAKPCHENPHTSEKMTSKHLSNITHDHFNTLLKLLASRLVLGRGSVPGSEANSAKTEAACHCEGGGWEVRGGGGALCSAADLPVIVPELNSFELGLAGSGA